MIPLKPFHFIRHGETDWNLGRQMMGHTDIPLNATGIEQAHEAALHLKNRGIKKIVASPFLRTKKTAEIIQSYIDVSIDFHEGIKECSWGIMEGVSEGPGQVIEKWLLGETPEGGESLPFFDERIRKSMKDILTNHDNVLVVAHGGVFCSINRSIGINNDRFARNCDPYYMLPKPFKGSWSIQSLMQEDFD